MHRLILMRHAKAEPATASLRDRDRPLSVSGQADAALMGRILASKGLKPDLALVSDAARTRETWEAMHEPLGDVEVRFEASLYNASPETLRQAVEAEEDGAGCLLILAHNPGVQLLAQQYLVEGAASPALLDRMAAGFPTAAAAVFEVDVAGRCLYDGYLLPKAFGGGAEE